MAKVIMFKNTEKFNKKNKERYDDSIIKHLISNQISCQIKNCKVYINQFSCPKTWWMTDYVQQIRKNSDFVAVHAGANDLPIKKKQILQLKLKPIHVTYQSWILHWETISIEKGYQQSIIDWRIYAKKEPILYRS